MQRKDGLGKHSLHRSQGHNMRHYAYLHRLLDPVEGRAELVLQRLGFLCLGLRDCRCSHPPVRVCERALVYMGRAS